MAGYSALLVPLSIAVSVNRGGASIDNVAFVAVSSAPVALGLRVAGEDPVDESLRKNNTGPSDGLCKF